MAYSLDDYVDVAERIRLFYERYPEGRLFTRAHGKLEFGGREFVYCEALAFRSPDDIQPCSGTAWEPFPGPSPFTRDSELMNAETSAWGRAIIAAGIPSKKIASAEEVRNRASSESPRESDNSRTSGNGGSGESRKTKPENLALLMSTWKALGEGGQHTATEWQRKTEEISYLLFSESDLRQLKAPELQSIVDETQRWLAGTKEPEVPFG